MAVLKYNIYSQVHIHNKNKNTTINNNEQHSNREEYSNTEKEYSNTENVPWHRKLKQHRTQHRIHKHNTKYIIIQSRSGKEIMCQVVQK